MWEFRAKKLHENQSSWECGLAFVAIDTKLVIEITDDILRILNEI